MHPPTTPRQSNRIIKLLQDGLSTCEVAEALTGVSKSLAGKYITVAGVGLSPSWKGGASRLVDSPTCCRLCRAIKDTEKWTSSDMRREINHLIGGNDLLDTARRQIKRMG